MRKLWVSVVLGFGLVLNSSHRLKPQVVLIEADKPIVAKSLGGMVVDPSGAALPGVLIDRMGLDWKEELGHAETNSQGTFNLHQRSPGQYFLQLNKPGFNPMRLRVILKKESKEQIRIQMEFST
jgi:hypothetical protein